MKFFFWTLSLFAFIVLPLVSATPATTSDGIKVVSAGNLKRESKSVADLLSVAADAAKKYDGPVHTRSDFTTGIIETLFAANPFLNYVICHGRHSYQFDGIKGVDWNHGRVYYTAHSHPIGFDVMIGGKGEFHRYGYKDGGADYWHYSGAASYVDEQTIKFEKAPNP